MIAPFALPSSNLIFDRWAEFYDDQPNPLLALEERTLPALLPDITGADVLDVGCGTGRWLNRFEALSPNSLAGIDYSSAMLERARQKLSPRTALHLGDAALFPGCNRSEDIILASFVLSYINDLSTFAAECARVLRPGGHLLLSDMHPVTAARRGWTRTVQAGDSKLALPASRRFLPLILTTFAQNGFRLVQLAEPAFGEPERTLFAEAGKLPEYTSLTTKPAIYLLKLQRLPNIPYVDQGDSISGRTETNGLAHFEYAGRNLARAALEQNSLENSYDLHLANAPWSANPFTWDTSKLSIRNGSFFTEAPPKHSLDLEGYVLLPGLINSHDHLEFALFPNLGRVPCQPPYSNATEWATEIHQCHARTIAQHLQIPLETRLWWGAIRNLLSGVTTVCHHNAIYPTLTAPGFPVRVINNFGWAHSLAFDPNLIARFQTSSADFPFILHAAEGTDSQSREEVPTLKRLHLLDHRTVLVHGLALSHSDVGLLNQCSAAVILCPTSNRFLFNQTLSAELLGAIERKALGSDSPLTAAGDLLDEIHYLHTQLNLDPVVLYRLVTTSSAAVLHLKNDEGCISPGRCADTIAVRDVKATPAQTLARLTFADIELVLIGGQVQVASPKVYVRLPLPHRVGLHLLQIEGRPRYVRAPLPDLFGSAEQILGRGNIRLGNKEVRHATAL